MDSNATPTTWAVDSQVPRTRANASGMIEEGFDISFHTGAGHAGTIFVPASRYNAANVKAAIAEQAVLMDQVGNLTHES